MQAYNGRQEAKMRSELKNTPAPYSGMPPAPGPMADRPLSQYPDMRGAPMYGLGPSGSYDSAGYGPASMGGYAPTYDYGAYGGMPMSGYGMPEGAYSSYGAPPMDGPPGSYGSMMGGAPYQGGMMSYDQYGQPYGQPPMDPPPSSGPPPNGPPPYGSYPPAGGWGQG